jgi:hypothetical protein
VDFDSAILRLETGKEASAKQDGGTPSEELDASRRYTDNRLLRDVLQLFMTRAGAGDHRKT